MSIGWAILGTGDFPENKVAPALNLAEGSELIAVLSRNLHRSQEFANKHGAKVGYDSIEAVLNDSRVDAVYIATPTHLHAPYSILASQAGKHVLMEKPIALNMSDGLDVVLAARSNRVKLGVGFELRQHPGRIEAKNMVLTGTLGTVALAQAQFGTGVRGAVHPVPRSGYSQWWVEPEQAGGAFAMMALGIHCVDDLQFMLGQEVIELAAITDGQNGDRPLEDLATLCLRFSQGTIGMVATGFRMPNFDNLVSLYGSDGKIDFEEAYPPHTLQGKIKVSSETVNTTVSYPSDGLLLVQRQIESFNRAIQQGHEPAANGTDGLKAVQIIEAMIESAATGTTVKLKPLEI
ncbi:MAG: Gfo/Idh/MocA family oxidoreductase [Chloroflexota bacterium]|nr:Gfo/Idh/MocA family oxidoreductase [Chloroflexota bacterium]